jgi:hypothetical protein
MGKHLCLQAGWRGSGLARRVTLRVGVHHRADPDADRLTTVGLLGAPQGLQPEDRTLAARVPVGSALNGFDSCLGVRVEPY